MAPVSYVWGTMSRDFAAERKARRREPSRTGIPLLRRKPRAKKEGSAAIGFLAILWHDSSGSNESIVLKIRKLLIPHSYSEFPVNSDPPSEICKFGVENDNFCDRREKSKYFSLFCRRISGKFRLGSSVNAGHCRAAPHRVWPTKRFEYPSSSPLQFCSDVCPRTSNSRYPAHT